MLVVPINLPDWVLPWQLAQAQCSLQGKVPLALMSRLEHELLGEEEYAWVEWMFDHDGGNRYFARGRIQAHLRLPCQRCLQIVSIEIATQTQIGLMADESEIQQWSDQYEPWIVKPTETASLWNLVEEELLLALPLVVRHSVGECPKGEVPKLTVDQDKQEERVLQQRGSNPFSILNKLEVKGKSGI